MGQRAGSRDGAQDRRESFRLSMKRSGRRSVRAAELAENAIALDVNKLDVRLNREQAKPRVNAFANLSAAGLSGVPLPAGPNPISQFLPGGIGTCPALFVGNYGQSFSNLFAGNFPTAQVGVQISCRCGIGRRRRSRDLGGGRPKAEGVRDQIGMAIEADVRKPAGATSAQSRLEAAELARRSAEEQYASEQRQFQAGTSTVFLVLQRQTELIVARSREVRARADIAEAIANLDRATARTMEAAGIEAK